MRRQAMQDTEQRILEQTRLRFFSDALVLKTLCEADSLKDFDTIRQALDIRRRRGSKYYELFNGYKLVVATALYCLLDAVIEHPSLLGLNDDKRLWEWWTFSRTKRDISSRAGFSSPESDLADVAVQFDDLLTRIKRADRWDSLLEVAGQSHSLGAALWAFGSHCPITWFKNRDEHLETQEALRRGAIERIDDYVQHRMLSLAYEFVWRGEGDLHDTFSEVQPEDLSKIKSHLDYPPLLVGRRRSGVNWSRGTKVGICVVLDHLRPPDREWPDDSLLFGDFIEPNAQLKDFLARELNGIYPSMEYGLKPPPATLIQNLLTPIVSVPVVQPEDKLRALVAGDTTRLAAPSTLSILGFS